MLYSDYVPLVNLVGVFFQVRDDYMNLHDHGVRPESIISSCILRFPQYATNKGFAEDLTEGKFSFPIVHGVRADPSNHQLLSQYYLLSHSHSFQRFTRRYSSETALNTNIKTSCYQLSTRSHQILRLYTSSTTRY